MSGPVTYEDSGVSIERGDEFVHLIQKRVKATYNQKVHKGVGGFCSLFEIGQDRFLTASTDGVGTKLRVAQILGDHRTIGIDLVAMCVNDILCCGSRPLFFLDYYATGKLDLKTSAEILEGIIEGCLQAGMPLIGGETAEMPGIYQNKDYDLAGFVVGEVAKDELVDGENMQEGDVLLGLASSGFHSNGFSLIRQLILPHETDLLKASLQPTRIYTQTIAAILKQMGKRIKGMAHITGGGLKNIPRINPHFDYVIESLPSWHEIPSLFQTVCERSQLPDHELYTVFNMGIGFVLVVDPQVVDELKAQLKELGEKVFVLGTARKARKAKGEVLVYHSPLSPLSQKNLPQPNPNFILESSLP